MIIATQHYSRPQYSRQCLDALRRLDGIAVCTLVAHVDGGPGASEETIGLLRAADFCETSVTVHPRNLGVSGCEIALLDDAFSRGDFVVFVEEDILLAPDALAYFAWARDRYRDDHSVMTVATLNRQDVGPDLHHTARRRNFYSVWGSGMWRDRWEATIRPIAIPTRDGFDAHLCDYVRMNNLFEIYPILGRCQNVGEVSSLHSAEWFTPQWYAANHYVPNWAGDGRTIEPGPWREV